MSQKARPVADVSNSGFSPVPSAGPSEQNPLANRINEAAPGDGKYVTSGADPQGSMFEVKLKGMAVPDSRGAGTHKLKVWTQRTGSVPADVVLALKQGSNDIAAKLLQPGTSWGDAGFDLTEEQAGMITDYADLRVCVVAGRGTAPCCLDPLPPLVYATFSDVTGNCACVEGTYPMLWSGGGWAWNGSRCGEPAGFHIDCEPIGMVWLTYGLTVITASTWSCSPLHIDFGTVSVAANLCIGSAKVVVTETPP